MAEKVYDKVFNPLSCKFVKMDGRAIKTLMKVTDLTIHGDKIVFESNKDYSDYSDDEKKISKFMNYSYINSHLSDDIEFRVYLNHHNIRFSQIYNLIKINNISLAFYEHIHGKQGRYTYNPNINWIYYKACHKLYGENWNTNKYHKVCKLNAQIVNTLFISYIYSYDNFFTLPCSRNSDAIKGIAKAYMNKYKNEKLKSDIIMEANSPKRLQYKLSLADDEYVFNNL